MIVIYLHVTCMISLLYKYQGRINVGLNVAMTRVHLCG